MLFVGFLGKVQQFKSKRCQKKGNKMSIFKKLFGLKPSASGGIFNRFLLGLVLALPLLVSQTGFAQQSDTDAKELVEIKLGKLRYEEIVRMFDNELKNLDKALENSKLPESPRYNDADNLMIRILKEFNY